MNTNLSQFLLNDLDLQLVASALREDLGYPYQDLTTDLLFPSTTSLVKAQIISKHSENITLSGLMLAEALLSKFDTLPAVQVQSLYQDGQTLAPGEVLLTLMGPAAVILMIERTLLNFLQRLCAIATSTAKFVTRIATTTTKILDTRKSLPGFRHLDKYAVLCGGGVNHRQGLYDAIMIKDTHIDFLGGMANALRTLAEKEMPPYPVIVEVRNLEELEIVLNLAMHKVTRVLLDNMSPTLIKQCVSLCEHQLPTEASGNINLDNVLSVAECGVDFISIGKLTHSASHIDLSMQCQY